jgi:hypothetical protein
MTACPLAWTDPAGGAHRCAQTRLHPWHHRCDCGATLTVTLTYTEDPA